MFLQRVMATMLAPLVLAMLLLLLNLVDGEDIHKRPDHAASRKRRDPDGSVESKPNMVPGNIGGHENTTGQENARKCKEPDSDGLQLTSDQNKSVYDLGEKIQVTCAEGYQPAQSVMECSQSANEYTWHTSLPCVKQCKQPNTSGTRLSFDLSKPWYNRTERVYVTCSDGYRPSTSYIECRSNDHGIESDWDLHVICIQQCRKPNSSQIILEPSQDSYDRDVKVKVTCSSGHRSLTPAITCKEKTGRPEGQWNVKATCIQQCKQPSTSGTRLSFDPSNPWYNRKEWVSVTCSEGYQPSKSHLQCRSKDQGIESDWNAPVTCIQQCKKPEPQGTILTVSPSRGWYMPGERVDVMCSWGYRSLTSQIICNQNPQNFNSDWDVQVTCIQQCRKPNSSQIILEPSQDWYDRDATVNVRCFLGYRPSTPAITCKEKTGQSESHWTETATCIQQCKKPETQGTRLTVSPSQGWYRPGDTVRVWCSGAYRPSMSQIICKQNPQNFTSGWDVQVTCIREVVLRESTFNACNKMQRNTGRSEGQWNETAACIQQCGNPFSAQMSLEPFQYWYDRDVTVKVTCSSGYQPSTPAITCKEKTGQSEGQWTETATCIQQCKRPGTQNPRLRFNPPQDWYNPGDRVTVTCIWGQYRPSKSEIVCQQKYQSSNSDWDAQVTCIQQCRKPISAQMSLEPSQYWYDRDVTVKVTCSSGYQPSTPAITCKENTGQPESQWTETATCIHIKQESLQKTADSISLRVTCNGRNCLTFWRTSVTAQPATPCCGKGCPLPDKNPQCTIRYPKWEERATCTSLQPFTWYNVTVYGKYSASPWNSFILHTTRVRTEATAPDAPEPDGMMGKEEDGTIRWKKLSDCKGTIEAYQLNITSWRMYNKTFWEAKHVTVNSSATEYTVTSPGTNYTVTVQGFNEAGLGAASRWIFATKIKAPILPPIINTTEYNASATVNIFALPLHPVPDLHGPISEYQIIVSRQGHSSDDICQMGDLAPYNKSLEQDAYIAAALPAHNLTTEFVVGDGTTQHGHFNAPLSTDYNYTAFLRVISIWDEEQTQSCAQYGSTFTVSAIPEASSMSAGLLAALVLLVLVLFLAAIVAFFSLRRLRSKSPGGTHNGTMPLKRRSGKTKTSIPVGELLEVMKRLNREEMVEEDEQSERRDTDTLAVGRYAEYQKLESGLQHPSEAGSALNNRSKNRYKNIIPYDQSRVVLRGLPGGNDYINASYVDGYKSPNYFIACQGPLTETVADFWQMVWQEKSSLVVMLTGLVEKNKVKCEQYWPEQSQVYGDIQVTLCSVQQCTGHTIRIFSVQKTDAPQRMVEHLHYLQWPDHGVPSKPASLLRLVEYMNAKTSSNTGPVIVHCSAGIGRTGTFIALDILQKMALAEKKVDVYRCTEQMRERRVNMIQTKDQYVFLYDALTEGVLCGLTAVPVERFQQHVSQQKVPDPVTKKNGFCKEFQKLEKFSALYKLQSTTQAKKPENRLKNRNPEILPADGNRPILMSILNREGSPAYINAVYADSYDKEGHFIVTQLPLEETVAEFWSAVWDYRCTAIVMMNRVEDLDETYPFFWPENGELVFGPFTVMLNTELTGEGFTTRTLSVHKAGQSSVSELQVKLWQLDNWPMQQPQPQSPEPILSILGEVATYRQNDGHVIVTCWDGASHSGLFVAASNICEQIREESVVDPSHAVRLLKSKRCQLIPDVSQYTFLHQLALRYLDSFETYGNFK